MAYSVSQNDQWLSVRVLIVAHTSRDLWDRECSTFARAERGTDAPGRAEETERIGIVHNQIMVAAR